MIGFDFARTFNPPARLGTATGIVNVGGFVASLVTMLLVGIGLDLVGSDTGHGYALDDFRVALSRAVPDLGDRHRRHPHDPPQGAGPAGPRRRRRAADPGGHRPPAVALTTARSSANIAASAGGW